MDISSSRGSSSSSLTRGGGGSLKKSSSVKKSTSAKKSTQSPGKTNSNGPADKVSLSRDAKGTPKHKPIPDFSRWDSYVAMRPGTPSAPAASSSPSGPRSEAAASAASGGYDARFRKAASEIGDFSTASRETSAAHAIDPSAAAGYRDRAVGFKRAETHADEFASAAPGIRARASAATEAAQTARETERESALSSGAEADASRKYRSSFTRSTEPRSLWARTVPETFH